MPVLTRQRTSGSSEAPTRSRFARRRWRRRLSRWKVLALVLVAAVVAGAASWVVFSSDLTTVDDVQVDGISVLSADQVRAAADVSAGTPLIRVDLDAVAARVSELAPVASVDVQRNWPRTVQIVVTERKPVAVLAEGSGYRALDETGAVFRQYSTPPAGMPLVRADELPAASDGDSARSARADALHEVASVIGALDESVSGHVDYVEVASLDAIELVLDDGVRVRWGSAADSALKAEVLTAVMHIPAGIYDVSVPSMPTTSGTAPAS